MSDYNGWKNRATWNVALWLGNDEPIYRRVCQARKEHKGRFTSSDAMNLCVDLFGSQTPDGCKLSAVHWPSIAADINEMAGL
jgi:hypothetical protein